MYNTKNQNLDTVSFIPANRSVTIETDRIKQPNRNLRKITDKLVQKMARFILATKTVPWVVLDNNNVVLIGAEVVQAAHSLGLKKIPVTRMDNLTETEKTAIKIGYHKIQELAEWDREALKDELNFVLSIDTDFDFEAINIELGELDIILGTHASSEQDDNQIPAASQYASQAVSREGDVWILGENRLINGNSRHPGVYTSLVGEHAVRIVLTDPPYNVATKGHIGGKGEIQHREFLEAAGELSSNEFTDFLSEFIKVSMDNVIDGGLAYICMDFRHMSELLAAAENNGLAMLNLCVWCKNNGGMGSFYRSQHELVFVFKKGKKSHINNIQLGQHGRYRTNVWNYAGVNTFRNDRMEELSMHPTVKPVNMIADAILDSTRRDDYVLDPFAGSGTIFIACEKTGRRALGIELDPLYVDVAIRRWEQWTGKEAILKSTGESFKEREALSTALQIPTLPSPRKRVRCRRKAVNND